MGCSAHSKFNVIYLTVDASFICVNLRQHLRHLRETFPADPAD
jgi:hypothetical protein